MFVLKKGLRLSLSLIFVAVLSFFLSISMNVICSSVFTKETGYIAYIYEDEKGEKLVEEYEYTYTDEDGDGKDDGVDIKFEEYQELGYYANVVKVRSSLTGVGKGVFLTVTQIFNFILALAFASNSCYKLGDKESNLVRIGHIKEDKLKGLKIGLIGNIPFFIIFVLYVVMAFGWLPKFPTVWYAQINSHFYPLIMIINGASQTVSQLRVWQFILLFMLQLVVPLISTIAYILGYKEINLSEKLVYKKEGSK